MKKMQVNYNTYLKIKERSSNKQKRKWNMISIIKGNWEFNYKINCLNLKTNSITNKPRLIS